MSTISPISNTPLAQVQQSSVSTKPHDRDGDHDNDASESGVTRAQERAGTARALNVTA
jgi:hypothetical protein